MTLDWKNATDTQKNAWFAELVCGAEIVTRDPDMVDTPRLVCRWYQGKFLVADWLQPEPGGKWWHDWHQATYLHSFDAVLPWLEKDGNEWSHNIVRHFFGDETETRWARKIEILATKKSGMNHATIFVPKETPMPEAAMIALLRTKGIEVLT